MSNTGQKPGAGNQAVATTGGPGLATALDRLVKPLSWVSDALANVIFLFLIAAMSVAMVVYQFGLAASWLDDLLRMLLLWLVYLGSIGLCQTNDHVSMDAIYGRFPSPIRRAVNIFISLLAIGLSAYVAKEGWASMQMAIRYSETTPSGFLPAWPAYLIMPLSFALMALGYVRFLLAVLQGKEEGPMTEAERIIRETEQKMEELKVD